MTNEYISCYSENKERIGIFFSKSAVFPPPPLTTNLEKVVKASTPFRENRKKTSLEILETFQQCVCFRINEGL